jgi:hypothetical protein
MNPNEGKRSKKKRHRHKKKRHAEDRPRESNETQTKKKKRRRKKRKRPNLPDRLVIMPNPDKTFHEKWTEGRTIMNIPHPVRILMAGPPNSGKTVYTKNFMMHQWPPFERTIVVHCAPDTTREYDDMNFEVVSDIPGKGVLDGRKTLVILEDLDFKNMKKNLTKLNRLFGYWSTHHNCSVIANTQDFYQVPAIVRRCSNVFVLWPTVDHRELSTIAKRIGMTVSDLQDLFRLVKTRHDCIWIDKTAGSPYPIRFNGFLAIKRLNGDGPDCPCE